MLPYFRKVERYHTVDVDQAEHGYEGPIHTQSVTSTNRRYPLREPLRDAWRAAGVNHVADANSGSPQGLGELIENRKDGARQLTSSAYSLGGVHVQTSALVSRILLRQAGAEQVIEGVELSDGKFVTATKEIIISTGAYLTPKLLMLSGVGPESELVKYNIQCLVDLPGVGRNLFDHMAVSQWWRLREPAKSLAVGSSNFMKPSYIKGTPLDWVVTQTVPSEDIQRASTADGDESDEVNGLLSSSRSMTETLVVYAGANPETPQIPMDGSHITTTVVGLLPTSRGSVTLTSNDFRDPPQIDPNYNATQVDRCVMRSGLRSLMRALLDTKEGQMIVQDETVAANEKPLSSGSTDEELNERISARGK